MPGGHWHLPWHQPNESLTYACLTLKGSPGLGNWLRMLSLIGGAGISCLVMVGRVYSRGNQKKKAELLAFRRALQLHLLWGRRRCLSLKI